MIFKYIVLLASICLIGCSTVYVKKWHVNPDDMAQFGSDQSKCEQQARATNSLAGGGVYEKVYDYCLQKIGYRLEVTKEEEYFWQ